MYRIKIKLSFIYILIISGLLVSLSGCGGGSDSNNNGETLTVNIYERYNVPLNGAVVQLNNDTAGSQTTGESGEVVFNIDKGSTNDIHVFSPEGYDWYSEYGYTKTQLNIRVFSHIRYSTPPPTESSYIKLSGVITGYDPANKYGLQLESADGASYTIYYISITNNSYDVSIPHNVAVGTSINGSLSILEESTDPLTKQIHLSDVATMNTRTYVTVAQNGPVTQQNISMSSPKPLLETMLTVNNIQYPNDMTFSGSSVYEGHSSLINPPHHVSGRSRTNVNPVITYSSFLPQKSDEVYFSLSATNQNMNNQWGYSNRFNTAETVDISPWFVGPLNLFDGQTGKSISWNFPSINNQSTVPIEIRQFLFISPSLSSTDSFTWNISIYGDRNSISLPDLPVDITPLLNVGTDYNISNTGIAFHENQIENSKDQYRTEYISSRTMWRR